MNKKVRHDVIVFLILHILIFNVKQNWFKPVSFMLNLIYL